MRPQATKPLTRPRSQPREIDLAGRPSNRVTWLVRLCVRLCQIVFWLAATIAALPVFWIARRSRKRAAGAALVFFFQRLGATFIKIGQIMSTRPDLLSPEMIDPLTKLQDQVPSFDFRKVRRAIEEDFGRKLEEIFAEFDETPVASASVAQVHRAVLQEAELSPTQPSRVVAVKIRRPGIVRRAYLDEAILRFGARLLALLPTFSLISPVEAVSQFCSAVTKQLDFRIEAENNRRFCENFENDSHVVIPVLVDQLCSDRVLTMEFIDGVKDDKVRAIGDDPAFLARKIIEIGSKMVFQHGLVHADFHAGNVLFLPGNRVALLDVGLVGTLGVEDRRRYTFLFYYVVSAMGAEATKWFYEQAASKQVRDYAAYECDMMAVVQSMHDRPLEQVQMTARLLDIYGILRRHHLTFEATFTMANVAMMVAEGIAQKLNPKFNLTREMRPHAESALALSIAGPSGSAAPIPGFARPTSIAGGRYRIRRLLGEGVRKRVYLARDTRLERDVAIAFLRTEGLDAAGRARIAREARAVARLAEHPRIVAVYDSGEEAGVPYVISQYMGGGTLSGRLLRASDHRLPLDEALRFADQILQALEHAHARGIVHRDVKPENVWLSEDGFAKLGDFGLARMLGTDDGGPDGVTVGTALYMSPEQARGRGVDLRSDLYSFGATLYELLTGHPPFEAESVAEVIACHLNAAPRAPSLQNSSIPSALDAIVMRLLAKPPESRFESAAAVREALRGVHAVEAVHASGVGEPGVAAPAGIFVGREQEIAKLRKGLEETLAGRGRFFVLVGEPGIGKTRIAELLAGYARSRGSLVLTGRSFEGEGAPAYWPWVQILRGYLANEDPARLEADLGPGAAYVAQIVPQIRDAIPDLGELSSAAGEEARFRLFDAVTAFLKRVAATQPMFLLLDDLHWADKPSLLLLQFLVRELAGARIFIVGAYRDVDVQHGHPLAELLPALRRERAFERVLLRGLSEEDVRALVAALAGEDAPASFVRAIHRETEGNPFFIEETLRHLAEEGVVSREGGRWASRVSAEQMGLPEGIREVIGRRLARLSDRCRKVLVTAAVVGRDFDTRLLEHVAGAEPGRLIELLDEAARAQILEEATSGSRQRFSHALIRETLYAELGAAERVLLHQKIAEALHALYGDDAGDHLAELAYHFCEAAPAGEVDRAIEYATRAAERADEQLAYEDAAGFYERALRALDAKKEPDEGRRCELLIGLGAAQGRSGELARSNETLRHAAELAARSGRAEALARAALLYSGEELQSVFTALEQDAVPFLEMALATLPREDSSLRATVMGRLGGTLTDSVRSARQDALLDEGLAMATRLGDRRALAGITLSTVFAHWGTKPHTEVRTLASTFVRLADELEDDRYRLSSQVLAGMVAAEAGDVEAAEAAFANVERLAAVVHEPRLRWFAAAVGGGWALRAAEPARAEQVVQRTLESSGSGGDTTSVIVLGLAQKTMVLWQQGRIDDNPKLVNQVSLLSQFEIVVTRVLCAFFEALLGNLAEARALMDAAVPDDLSSLDQNSFRLQALVLCASIVERLGDLERARKLYDRLAALDDRIASLAGTYYISSASSALGLLAKQLSRFDDAVRHFEAASKIEHGMPIMLARTRLAHASTLALRAAPGDRERALVLLGQAIEAGQTYGLKKVAEESLALKLDLEGINAASTRSSIDAVAASIEAKGVDVREATAPDGTVTLVFSDVEGATEMIESRGDAEAHRIIQAHHRIIRGALRSHDGREIEQQGDGFLLAFPRASDALRYAVAVQRALAAHRMEHLDEPIHVRMGLNTGEPIREGNRFFGKTVILAARIAAHAVGDEILVSSLVRDLVESAEIVFDEGEEMTLAGLAGTYRVHGVVWDPTVPARRNRPPRASTARGDAPSSHVFRREGDYWTIVYEGRSIRMKDAKGVQYMAVLLRRPGEDVHVTDLVNGVDADASDAIPRSAAAELGVTGALGGDGGEGLDLAARSGYRERLESLRSELDDALSRNDAGRAESVGREIEIVTDELAAAYGVGGPTRRNASAADRARKAVSSRVSDSIARIRKQHPGLGAHLQNSIRLGLFCRYAPEKPLAWKL